ncbi:hypothetical protein ACFLTG_01260 [Chloroflexota bacterium]
MNKFIKEIIQKYGERFDTKILILLEDEEQVKDCLAWFNEIRYKKQIIALSPFAIYELDKQTLPYKIPEDYYDSQELYQIGLGNYQKVEDFCSLIDNAVHKACPITVESGIKPALFGIINLKIVYDTATIRLFQLLKVIIAEKPDVIVVYDSKDYPFGISEKAPYLFFNNRESVYTHLLKLPGWKPSVVVLPDNQPGEEPIPGQKASTALAHTFKDKVAKWLLLTPELYDFALAIRKRQWGDLFMMLKARLSISKNMPVLLFGAAYNWGECRIELVSAGIAPIFIMPDYQRHWLSEPFSEKVSPASLVNVWQELEANGEFRRYFVWQDLDFFPVVKERLQFFVERLTLACLKAYGEVLEIISNRGIKAILTSNLNTCTSHSAAQAAHNTGIPVINWQYGGNGHFKSYPIFIYNEMTDVNALLVWGEGLIEKYAESARRLGTQLIPVGSASLESLSKKKLHKEVVKAVHLNPEKKVVLYVTTRFYHNNLYISFPPVFSDNHYWHTQQVILDALVQHQDYSIIIKTHPNHISRETPLRWYARDKGFQNCLFVRNDYSYTDLLPLADVVVIDSPTTVLLQALTTSKPIFVFTGHLHIDDQKLLELRAFCHHELGGFVDGLTKFLSGGIMDIDLDDTEFLRKFGTADGTSGTRAAATLIDIMRTHSN